MTLTLPLDESISLGLFHLQNGAKDVRVRNNLY